MSTTRLIFWLLIIVTIIALLVVGLENFSQKDYQESNRSDSSQTQSVQKESLWQPPLPETISDAVMREMIVYGKDLIAHTAKYLGPKGIVSKTTNGMNCQNCHLEAGTKPWGNNYGSVASSYPKFRARSGSMEDIYKRVADCFERSLNGKAPDTNSREMQAIKMYIEFLGSNVKKRRKSPRIRLKRLSYAR